MASAFSVDALRTKRLCHKCIEEKYLRAEVRRKGQRAHCSYCGKSARSYALDVVAGRVEAAFLQHYQRTDTQPTDWEQFLLADKESDYEWNRAGEPTNDAIAQAAGVHECVAADIQALLDDKHGDIEADRMGEETDFCSTAHYEERSTSDSHWHEAWQSFESSLKTEARYFSRSASTFLASVFHGVDTLTSTDGKPLVLDAGPGTSVPTLFRARVFQSTAELETALRHPDRHLGSPPSRLALGGRMNARGISVFYGATDPTVALAEVRPPVGSRVAVASFAVTRQLRLLDLSALKGAAEPGSVFDSDWARRLSRVVFLRSLCDRISRPVMPNDEAIEYLPTQAIADFLATENEPRLDGIVFPSVQSGGAGSNIVLFHQAAAVEEIDIPPGTRITVHTERETDDGAEPDYTVAEEAPVEESAGARAEGAGFPRSPVTSDTVRHSLENAACPVKTLRIDAGSISIHHVQGVDYRCDGYEVRRTRSTHGDLPF